MNCTVSYAPTFLNIQDLRDYLFHTQTTNLSLCGPCLRALCDIRYSFSLHHLRKDATLKTFRSRLKHLELAYPISSDDDDDLVDLFFAMD